MYRIRLAAADRDRYGVPEWIEYDLYRPRLREMRDMQAQVGITWTALREQLWGRAAEDGRPAAEPTVDDRYAALGVICWLAVCRVASDRPQWDDFDLDLFGLDVEAVDPPGQAPDGASTS